MRGFCNPHGNLEAWDIVTLLETHWLQSLLTGRLRCLNQCDFQRFLAFKEAYAELPAISTWQPQVGSRGQVILDGQD